MNLGIIVEKATEIISIDEASFQPSTMNNSDTPIDGMIAINEGILITKITIKTVFEKLDERIFQSVDLCVNGMEN